MKLQFGIFIVSAEAAALPRPPSCYLWGKGCLPLQQPPTILEGLRPPNCPFNRQLDHLARKVASITGILPHETQVWHCVTLRGVWQHVKYSYVGVLESSADQATIDLVTSHIMKVEN